MLNYYGYAQGDYKRGDSTALKAGFSTLLDKTMDMQLLIAKKKFENQYDSLLEAKVNLQKKETNKNDNNNNNNGNNTDNNVTPAATAKLQLKAGKKTVKAGSTIALKKGKTVQLSLTINGVTGKNVKYKTSNKKVVKISSTGKMKAVIYARYSSDNQREASIEGQIRECTAFAEKNGITVLRHYIDRAISAKTDNRPEFQNMIIDSNKKLFDMIIVWKLDRFARNRYDSARYKAQLKKNGVKVVSATEVISDGAEGIILESMLEGFAEYYSVDLSEKVVRGMTDNALK